MQSTSFNVWVRYFVWNFKGHLWNSTQNILPIHWKMWFLYNTEILRALRFKSSYTFLKRPPGVFVYPSVCLPITSLSMWQFITPFKLGSTNLNQRCQTPLVKSPIVLGSDWSWLQGQIYLESQILPNFELVHVISLQWFTLSPNLYQKLILAILKFILILDLIGFVFQFHFLSKTWFGYTGPVLQSQHNHPICNPSQIIADWWCYCSMNPLCLQELYLLLFPPAVLVQTQLQSI